MDNKKNILVGSDKNKLSLKTSLKNSLRKLAYLQLPKQLLKEEKSLNNV